MKRIGILGCGRIGGPVIAALQQGNAGKCTLKAVLATQERALGELTTEVDPDAFFARHFDLIIDTAVASGLPIYGERALKVADVWTVNAVALADLALYQSLEAAGRQHGHRLRVLNGALAGLDGVAALAVDEKAEVRTKVDVAPSADGRKMLFKGSVRNAAGQFPDSVNVAVAAGLAGIGLDNTVVEVVQPGIDEGRNLGLIAESQYGRHEINSTPMVRPDKQIHTVAACIIAALRREDQTIWVG